MRRAALLVVILACVVAGMARADCPPAPDLPKNGRITIDVVNAPLDAVLLLIADEADVNFILSDGVEGTVTMRLRDVPLDEALALILCSQGLGYEQNGSVFTVTRER